MSTTNYTIVRTRVIDQVTATTTVTLGVSGVPAAPAGAIGLIGVLVSNYTNPVYPVLVSVQAQPDGLSAFQQVMMLHWKGSKAAYGFMPVTPAFNIQVSLTMVTAQAGSPAETGKMLVDLFWLVSANRNPLPPIPFQADNGQMNECGCQVAQTSAVATAQTLDIAPGQDIEYELTQAWYYTSAGAIAVTMNAYDGTTAVPVASPASATSGDLTPSGPRRSITGGGPTTLMWRASAPSAGVGNTSTIYISFIARIKK